MDHTTREALDAGLDHVKRAPANEGALALIVRRPAVDEREIVAEARLDTTTGLVGDTWAQRGSRRTDDGSAHPDMQLNIMNARVAELIARDADHSALAGDQLFIDLDISEENLPPGTRLSLGSAIIEVTDQPHTGCAKFSGRFGADALRWVNSPVGRSLRLRGMNAKVVESGTIRSGDIVSKL